MKALALIDSDETLKGICEALQERKKALSDRVAFLQKQVEDAEKKFEDETDPLWNAMVNRLKEMGKLPPDYDRQKTEEHLSYEIPSNLISLEKTCNHDHSFMIPIPLPPGFNPFNRGPGKSS